MNAAATTLDIEATLGPDTDEEDWQFCWDRLLEVSRTFSRPIAMLPGQLRVATTVGYLLCRIADTVEDHPTLSIERRDALYQAFLNVMERDAAPETFTEPFSDIPGDSPEHHLAEELPRVLHVFDRLPPSMQETCRRWVVEMTRGMQLYSHRPTNDSDLVVLENLSDLERYCYFVAGTVGHLLTGLFLDHIDDISAADRNTMNDVAESFGLGLQMVNIVKDQTDDLQRGWCFIPQTLAEHHGLQPTDVYEPDNRAKAHEVVQPIIDRAHDHLDDALEYTLAIPSNQQSLRLFCLLPLWMAVRTLVHAEGNDQMFIADEPVKISRSEVESLIADAVEHVGDDEALRRRYQELWDS
jgi:farnesyl-diphosphate farnesyltransferase